VDPIDVAASITVPVLGHYAENDPEIPLAQLKDFEASLKKNNSNAQILIYTGAYHGFFDYSDPPYDANASKMAWERTVVFLKKYLGH
jgi:carboxymethylenebutenolidase